MDDVPPEVRLEAAGHLTPSQVAAITDLVGDATDADGVRPLSEHVLLHLRYGGDRPARNLLAWQGSRLLAYAHLDSTDPVEGPSAELVVDPAVRRGGYGRMLIKMMLEQTGGRLRLWAHGDLPEASAMAEHLGFRRARVLWQMRRSLAAPLPRPELPDAISIRTFEPGSDDQAWLELNARTFADHPEQGSWTIDDLHQRMGETWFDPAGFFLAERDGKLVGFHWTKVHGSRSHVGGNSAPDTAAHAHAHHHANHHHDDESSGAHTHVHAHEHPEEHGHEPIGEVYVVGVDDAAQGMGLGRLLTVVGLRHLRAQGLQDVMLYVDESNTAAIGLYESLGFARWNTDVLFRHG